MQPSHTVTGPGPGDAAHAQRPAIGRPGRIALSVALVCLAAIGGAVAVLVRASDHTTAVPASARAITASPRIPLGAPDLIALTGRPPEYGPLADPRRRADCLRTLGFPESVRVLGARTIGEPASVVLMLAGPGAGDLLALQVRADCGAGPDGLVAQTSVRRS